MQRIGIALLLSLFFFAGCGAVLSTTSIIDARNEIKIAEKSEADIYAPYEYTKAVLLLKKAKELQGHTEYQQADLYAVNAKSYAQKAVTEGQKRRVKLEKIKKLKDQYKLKK